MNNAEYTDGSGPFEARYLALLETITNLRPSLHRYCSRMTGSVMDGEDVVQDALFHLAPGIGHWHPHMMVFSPYYGLSSPALAAAQTAQLQAGNVSITV